MVPLRVYLKNFLCYDEQEFNFDGHPVWLLFGHNGAGKSAVFDAILYVLYKKTCRGDDRKNSVDDIIRHGQTSLRVEFDFEISGKRYQVWRTRSRNGTAKQGVNSQADGTWSPVLDVNSVTDIDTWVVRTLGLNYEAFISALLLRQGAAEKLIDTDKDARRELFRNFIDIEPYIEVHDRVVEERKILSADCKRLRAELAGQTPVTDEELTEATVAEQTARLKVDQARSAERLALDRLGHARAWDQYDSNRRKVVGELDAARERAQRSADIQKQYDRLQELRVLVPGLMKVKTLQETVADASTMHQGLAAEKETNDAANREMAAALEQLRTQSERDHEQQRTLKTQIMQSQADKKDLTAQIERARKAAGLHEDLKKLRARQFDPDLDRKVSDAQQAAIQGQEARDALPHIEMLVQQRTLYRAAVTKDRAAAEQTVTAKAEVERLLQAEAEAAAKWNAATQHHGDAGNALAVADTKAKQAVERRDHFAAAARNEVCAECGQKINTAHAAEKKTTLEKDVQETAARVQEWETAVHKAEANVVAFNAERKTAEGDRRQAEHCRDDAGRAETDARQRAAEATTAFARACRALSQRFVDQVAGIEQDGYPTPHDEAALRTVADKLKQCNENLEGRKEEQRQRDQTLSDIDVHEKSVAAVGAPIDVSAAQLTLAELEGKLQALDEQLETVDTALTKAIETTAELQKKQELHRERLTHLAEDLTRAETRGEVAKRDLEIAMGSLPMEHQTTAAIMTAGQVQELGNELAQLTAADIVEQHTALAQDRALLVERERRLAEIQENIARLREDARCPATEVQKDVDTAEQAMRRAEQQQQQAGTDAQKLTIRREKYVTLENDLRETELKHTLHDRLAGLLGKDGIQLDLVRSAECRIVRHANSILERLSNGRIHFEPPEPDASRAFDISVRISGCPEPIRAANLSGGQRFRVAVSLALAVCQGAADGARPLESVIIDEGFGCLDREGRMAMIDELRGGNVLSGLFKKVIVVSHQEDFAAAFPTSYHLRLEGGTTKSALVPANDTPISL